MRDRGLLRISRGEKRFSIDRKERSMCLFCDIVNRKIDSNIIYEDALVMAFLDIEPIYEGHMLLIPKTHYLDVDEIPLEVLQHLMMISQKLVKAMKKAYHSDGYSIMQNGGMFNDIGHYHLHIFPRYQGDGFGWVDADQEFEVSKTVADKIRKML